MGLSSDVKMLFSSPFACFSVISRMRVDIRNQLLHYLIFYVGRKLFTLTSVEFLKLISYMSASSSLKIVIYFLIFFITTSIDLGIKKQIPKMGY